MKSSLSFLALATTVLAVKEVRGNKHDGGYPYPTVTVPGPPVYVPTTTWVDVTYTTTCPVTETVTAPGNTYTTTYTTTSVCYTQVPTVIYETVKGPDVTETKKDVAYTTITSLCPVTETKTIGGSTVCVTWTSTSTIVKEVPTTVPVYVTSITTEYKTTDVYTTTTCPVVTYTTVIEGSTICITETNTKYITYSTAYTVTEVIPVTQTKEVDTTIAVTVGGGETVTQESVTVVYVGSTLLQTFSSAPATVVVPTTATSTTESGVVTAAANNDAPAVALIAGIFGAMALL